MSQSTMSHITKHCHFHATHLSFFSLSPIISKSRVSRRLPRAPPLFPPPASRCRLVTPSHLHALRSRRHSIGFPASSPTRSPLRSWRRHSLWLHPRTHVAHGWYTHDASNARVHDGYTPKGTHRLTESTSLRAPAAVRISPPPRLWWRTIGRCCSTIGPRVRASSRSAHFASALQTRKQDCTLLLLQSTQHPFLLALIAAQVQLLL